MEQLTLGLEQPDTSCLFDEVSALPILNRLIGMTLRSGVWTEGVVEIQQEGQPQGSPLSPLLSNIILSELDEELEKRGLRFVRYADDANIFVGSEKAAKRVLESVSKFIEKKLKLRMR